MGAWQAVISEALEATGSYSMSPRFTPSVQGCPWKCLREGTQNEQTWGTRERKAQKAQNF